MSTTSSENMRLFLALWPDDTTRNALTQLQLPLAGRKVPYENLHLTLAFLGPQPQGVAEACKDILARLQSPAIELRLDKVGYFARNRIAWVGAHASPPDLLALHEELGQALAHHGIERERQQFKPHVTLARDASMPVDMTFSPIVWRASLVTLVRSRPTPAGSVYEVLAQRSLDEALRMPDAG
ncbi:RNA 2',3'-cyclic phosphodiesterase [Noviherbaspirillum aridicola]|uniref:RNA 2',3'-cyclic phosphodiesterase n=1 Tax=Noviherbaspirillum aridicola TaxID=2849687 RepID=A0ABQ4Q821_9BURK|nr:RNA 2',3'-cyclic phosphodiesterase [Noviherbaspirillum aridicola]GIZ53184.1 RNA 2',3'-cyclic phosphodiesterase [Noviherbaspirillum aridicola]